MQAGCRWRNKKGRYGLGELEGLRYISPMMYKRLFILFFLGLSLGYAQKQRLKTTALDTAPLEPKQYVGFDGMENHYYIKDNVFLKEHGVQKWEYKNIALGTISAVDIINPLRIVLFYENFNTIVTLDNQLNVVQQLNLFDIDSSIFASKIGMAAQNQFWIYNALTQQVLLFDSLKHTFKTVGNPIQENIKYTQSDFNSFYWVDENNNWFAMDVFGKVTLLANIPPWQNIEILDRDRLLFSYDSVLYCLNTQSKVLYEIEIVEKSFQNFYYKDQILAIFTNQEIKNFKLKLP